MHLCVRVATTGFTGAEGKLRRYGCVLGIGVGLMAICGAHFEWKDCAVGSRGTEIFRLHIVQTSGNILQDHNTVSVLKATNSRDCRCGNNCRRQ